MNSNFKLVEEWSIFKENIEQFVKEADAIFKKEKTIKTIDDLVAITEEIKLWKKNCFEYLNSSFDEEQNVFAIEFHNAKEDRFSAGIKIELGQKIKNTFADLKAKRANLLYSIKILNICDAVTKPNSIDLDKRAEYSMEETFELILDKLYELYDDMYHPISVILIGNEIVLKRYDEERGMIKLLEERELVAAIYNRDVVAQLTTRGRIHVEEKRKKQTADYSKIGDSQAEINKRIEEVLARLEELGLGQEIIFDELSELKDLYGKMDNKNWGQLLKGKIVDLGVSQVINVDTAKMLFEGITQEVL